MSTADSAKCYLANSVNTASPGRLTLMLYDGGIRFMATAVAGFEEPDPVKRIETIHNNLVKAQNILRELQSALDLNGAGGFSERMFALYDYMIAQLAEANRKKEAQPIQLVEELLGKIRNAWATMLAPSESVAA
ncbi:MAG TPA: flagellar export chaperone FliS [Chthoniobacterales bacterium]